MLASSQQQSFRQRKSNLSKKFRISVYYQIFKGCGLINNLTSAIECGRKLLVLLRECGMKHKEAAVSIKTGGIFITDKVNIKKRQNFAKKHSASTQKVATKRGEGICYVKPRGCLLS